MKHSYHLTGAQRKALVEVISAALNIPFKYRGAPTFAYEVGGYHIDKDGTLTGEDNPVLAKALQLAGFEVGESSESESDMLVIAYPVKGFIPENLESLRKMIAAKEALIQAALGIEDLPIRITEENIEFPWFKLSDPSEVNCYTQFVIALCKATKEKTRVTAKVRGLGDNPKYAMRCWLLSLGLIGEEYKKARKLLLSRLEGNSSFKSGKPRTHGEEDKMQSLSKVEKLKWQCRQVAQTGRTNMFDGRAARSIALEMGFEELANLITRNSRAYSNLILTGEVSEE